MRATSVSEPKLRYSGSGTVPFRIRVYTRLIQSSSSNALITLFGKRL